MIIAVPLGLLVYTMYQDGAFDTTKNSVMILVAGINRFRRLGGEDMGEIEEMHERNREAAGILEKRLEEEKRQRETQSTGKRKSWRRKK